MNHYYFDNGPFIKSMSNTIEPEQKDNLALFLIGSLIIIGGTMAIYYHQQKSFNRIISNLQMENARLKRAQKV
jgi:hypothetical protein